MSLVTASQAAAKRLRIFQQIASQASARDERVDLAPSELWEPKDQEALESLEHEIRLANGERPLLEIAS
mgnify:CR=1 FL=1